MEWEWERLIIAAALRDIVNRELNAEGILAIADELEDLV
jgi:hypothetical protein